LYIVLLEAVDIRAVAALAVRAAMGLDLDDIVIRLSTADTSPSPHTYSISYNLSV